MNISETSGNKFYLKHHQVGERLHKVFGPDRIGTLVSMATNSSHRVIMGKILLALLIGSSSFLQISWTTIISRRSSNFGTTRPRTAELAVLERQKKFP